MRTLSQPGKRIMDRVPSPGLGREARKAGKAGLACMAFRKETIHCAVT